MVAGFACVHRRICDARIRAPLGNNGADHGARRLFGDDSVIPVRGQTARLIPQPEVTYGLYYEQKDLFVVPRRDGILVQAQAPGDFGNPDAAPDRAASEAAVAHLATLFQPAVSARAAPTGR